jgi:hypothetical protein
MRRYLILILLHLTAFTQAQSILDRSIRVKITNQSLGRALDIIGNTGGFTFSYNSTILNRDSVVTLPEQTNTVREILDKLFNGRLEYRENGRYLILLPATPKPPPPPPQAEQKHYIITGVILDEVTGEKVPDASVYDANRMIATLSKEDGSFVIKFRSSNEPGSLTISKEFYLDTTIHLPSAAGRLTILLSPTFSTRPVTLSPQTTSPDTINIVLEADSAQIKAILKKDLVRVEMTGFGRLLLSSRLKMQSLNLKSLFIQRPVQLSLVPRLSTNGALNSQVTNKFSVNIIGGYSGGLEGVGLGGVFNIDRRKAIGFQAAGVANIAGDTVAGVQMAGVYNRALDSMKGVQAAGAVNVARNLKGVQLSGAVNLANHANGAQLGVINITRHLKGFQLGVINIADTSDGASLGLFNFVRHGGMHELSLFADEFSPLNIAYRSGNKAIYTILLFGMNPSDRRRSYYAGFGIGHRFPINNSLAIDLEASSIHIAPVEWKNYSHNTWLQRLNLNLRWQTGKWLSFSAGPSVALYNPDRVYTIGGHTYQPVPYSTFTVSGNNIGWIGWHAAINFL